MGSLCSDNHCSRKYSTKHLVVLYLFLEHIALAYAITYWIKNRFTIL